MHSVAVEGEGHYSPTSSSHASTSRCSLESVHETQSQAEDRVSHCSESEAYKEKKSIHDNRERDLEQKYSNLVHTPTNQSKNTNGNALDMVRSHVSHQDMHASDNAYREENAEQYERFSPGRKVLIVTILACCSFLAPISSTSILPAVPEVAATFDTTGSVINASNAVFTLFMGLSSTFWGTFSQILGRRPVSDVADNPFLPFDVIRLTGDFFFRCHFGVRYCSSYLAWRRLCRPT